MGKKADPAKGGKRNEKLMESVAKLLGPTSDPNIQYYLSTGFTLLDLAIQPALPGGRMTEIFGPAAEGKTLTAGSIAAQAQAQGGSVKWMDAEGRLSASLMKLVGLDCSLSSFHRWVPPHLEQCHRALELMMADSAEAQVETIKAGGYPAPEVYVVDSIASLGSEKEEGEDSRPLYQAQLWTAFFRKNTLRKINGLNIHLILINQLRDEVDFFAARAVGGKKYKTPGGKAIAYNASTRINVTQRVIEKTSRARLEETDGYPIGKVIEYEVVKNTGAPPGREAFVPFFFHAGPDNLLACFEYVLDARVQSACSTTWVVNGSYVSHHSTEARNLSRWDWLNRIREDIDATTGDGPLYSELRSETARCYRRMSLYDYGD